MNEVLGRIREFHGHLGPYVVIGYRMGLLALEQLRAKKYFGITVESFAGDIPPVSCMNDGLQLSTGCTFGKGNIRNIASGDPCARITSGGRAVVVRLKPAVQRSLPDVLKHENEGAAAEHIFGLPDEELFDWEPATD
ncbi:MAG: formylmethanofuran dehydrogenase [Firmicutes bacterium]|nr:formylmethanofuran dehydrogenase [Bacillota bacterium]